MLYLDLACKNLCFPPGEGINRKNESTKTQVLVLFCSTDDNTQYCYFPTLYYSKLLKHTNWFSFSEKTIK